MSAVSVCEIFESIQGESSYAGLSCFFIRLAGCNLRCKYCDTVHSYEPGKEMSIERIVADCMASGTQITEITGGEPLIQPAFGELAIALRDRSGKKVLVETNGSQNIAVVPEGVITIMDVKCPGSGECGSTDLLNIGRLRPDDEIKFVITDKNDYEWAKTFVVDNKLGAPCGRAIFSPAHGTLETGKLAQWILKDALPVRIQIQLHKVLGVM